MIPQDATISIQHEENQVHHENVKDASAAIGSKTHLQHLQTLNKYINAKNFHSTMILSNHDIIKSISYMKILQVYIHTTKVLIQSETKISKLRRYKPNQELILHCHLITIKNHH